MLRSLPALVGPTRYIFNTRVSYDSTGPVFFNQAKGFLAYVFPNSQLVPGSGNSYAPNTICTGSIKAIVNATFLDPKQTQDLFHLIAETLFEGEFAVEFEWLQCASALTSFLHRLGPEAEKFRDFTLRVG
ncbi:hypothetical protein ABVK25_002926 [Lepraria finkii]|uniref:Uncharacterized protein n=1 Tax=Lepraria finkii TaxID=1340010 RepID=A0ABR4BFB2_9LECA